MQRRSGGGGTRRARGPFKRAISLGWAMAVALTGYGGVGEIGGNAFLLEAPGLRVFLDLGKRFGATSVMKEDPQTGRKTFTAADFTRRAGWNDYFDTFLQPRTHSAVRDQAA